MSYHIKVASSTERDARIRESLAISSEREDFYDFRGTKTSLPVIRIPIDVPIYRMKNFRTYSDQAEFAARAGKDPSFFQEGQENESVQQIQHELLNKLAQRETTSVVSIADVLEREGQRETLLITHSGVVVNGNRRLAAMRELVAKDAGTYSHFGHVSCKVLPADTSPDDILEIEGILQAKPETRLEYDWVGDAQLLSAMLNLKETPEAVARFLGRSPSEVKNVLQALAEADLYLRDWLKTPGQYGPIIENGEQFFKDLPKHIQGKSVTLQDASRAVAWTLFENGEELEGRLYNYNVVFGKRAEDVVTRLSEALGVANQRAVKEEDSDYDFVLDDDGASPDYGPFIDILRHDSPRKAEAIAQLVSVANSVVESEKDQRSGNAALKSISSANTKLTEVDLGRAAAETYDAISQQLASISQVGSPGTELEFAL